MTFGLEPAPLVADENHSIRETAAVVGVGHSTMNEWHRQLPKNRKSVTPTQSALTPERRFIKAL